MAELKAVSASPHPGSPLIPTGDPMVDGLGPAAWADRADVPDLTMHGEPKIVPMSALTGWTVADGDPDPRGLPVYAVDGEVAGTIVDIWVDRSEPQVRYYTVRLAAGEDRVLVPTSQVQWPNFGWWGTDHVTVKAITAAQFRGVPRTKFPDRITLLEEDRIMAYYGGGFLYATPERSEPLL